LTILKSYKWALWALLLTYILSALYVNFRVTKFQNVIHADAAGYYIWLPAIFIYQDSEFEFTDSVFSQSENHPRGSFKGTIVPVQGDKAMNKYSIGPAICELPFFAVAHIYGTLIHQNKGFEIHYQISWLLGAVAFVMLGCFFQFRLAYHLKLPVWLPVILTASLLFGTNLFHYTSFDAGYSHAFTFGLFSGLLFYSNRIFRLNKPNDFIWLAICGGMMVLARPFNIVLLFPSLLYIANPMQWWQIFRANFRTAFIALLLFFAFVFINFLGNYWQTGSFFIYSYGEEKFNFHQPHWMDFLFGFQIGAFIYSPLLLVSLLLAVVFLALRKKWYRILVFVSSFCLISWVLSCWGTWTFGCTLGNRPLTDFSAWILFVLISELSVFNTFFIVALTIISGAGITYNQILHYQFRNFILDWCNMNKQKFMDVFMKTKSRYAYFTADDWSFDNARNSRVLKTFVKKEEIPMLPNEINDFFTLDSLKLDSTKQYRILFRCDARFSKEVTEETLVIHISQNNNYHDYLSKMFKKMVRKPDNWKPFRFEFYLKPAKGQLKVVFGVQEVENQSLWIRNITADVIEYDSP